MKCFCIVVESIKIHRLGIIIFYFVNHYASLVASAAMASSGPVPRASTPTSSTPPFPRPPSSSQSLVSQSNHALRLSSQYEACLEAWRCPSSAPHPPHPSAVSTRETSSPSPHSHSSRVLVPPA
ncbi:hypothetical protein M430DRAFT_189320 [Amorphotheca resinae ATCC 22711]|uniref:Uncharacterized protein n=1 Tax=Amorphotheca resinae ATCC 22711 TaxID=857342 RepID=A0A2T3ARC3_AMORE|nr:hypothetical protein M430DRAFT_189320 [Amorphotheca resinae ATCC 22711]PSS08782.1 hypothetical protein M430DRAFT_189320 [Amorphotheca resinae ATCC 22711]